MKLKRRLKRGVAASFLLIALALVTYLLHEQARQLREQDEIVERGVGIVNRTMMRNKTLQEQLSHAKEFQNRCVKNGVAKYDEWGEIILLK